MTNKTTQALKITASWTPNEANGQAMMSGAFEGTPVEKARIAGGRMSIKLAYAIDYANPAHVAAVSTAVARVKRELEASGTLHGFNTVGGSVPVEEAETIEVNEGAEAAA